MDKDTTIRTTLVIVLTLGVVLLWTYFFPPPAPEPAPAVEPGAMSVEQAAEGSGAEEEARALEARPGESVSAAAGSADAPPPIAEVIGGDEGQAPIELVTGTQAVTLSARGGRVVSWKLLDYSRDPADPESGAIDLVSPEQRILDRHPLILETGDEELTQRVNEAWYAVERDLPYADELAERELPEGTQRVTMRWADGSGLEVTKAFYLPPTDDYMSRLEWSITQGGRPVPGASVAWGPGVARTSGESSMYTRGGAGGVIARGEEKERFDADDLDGGTRFVPASANPSWIGIDGRYFAVAMVKAAGSGHASLRAVEVPQSEDDDAEPRRIVMESGARELLLFTGPKEDRLLRDLDDKLNTKLSGLVDWGFFGFIARPLYLGIAWLYEKLGNWGFAIAVMTILIRLAFIPLTQRSMISMRRTQERMAKLQPKIRKIKDKYRDKRDMESRRKMNEETMALYQKEGVNPMSSLAGCFPLLLQLPVLYGMFRMLTVVVELRGAPFFGWIVDLSAPDPYFITPIIMGVTMFAQQLMTMAKTEDPQQRSQQRIMLFMPLMFTYFFLWAPSGLVVYWLVNNILGIGQQYFVNRHTKRAAAAAA